MRQPRLGAALAVAHRRATSRGQFGHCIAVGVGWAKRAARAQHEDWLRCRCGRIGVNADERRQRMPTITTTDGTEIFYKDWGSGQPVVFSHGWPLSADDWDTQMLSSYSRATASSPMIGVGTDAPPRPATVTTWTTTPTTSL